MLACESRRALRALSGVGIMTGVLLVAGVALAQTPPSEGTAVEPAAPPPADPEPRINLTGSASPTIDLSTPPPPPRVLREYHRHEGFYLRMGGGLGYLGASLDTDVSDEFDSSGMGLNFELLVGGGPAPGLAIGGAVLGSVQLFGDWEADDIPGSTSGDLTTFIIGPFADGYPDPNGGWHLGGMLGLATASFDVPGGDDGVNGIGFGGAGWVGYDVWVAPEWSMGGALRLDALRATDDDVSISSLGITLAISVVYN
jgi:hypothetical protein